MAEGFIFRCSILKICGAQIQSAMPKRLCCSDPHKFLSMPQSLPNPLFTLMVTQDFLSSPATVFPLTFSPPETAGWTPTARRTVVEGKQTAYS